VKKNCIHFVVCKYVEKSACDDTCKFHKTQIADSNTPQLSPFLPLLMDSIKSSEAFEDQDDTSIPKNIKLMSDKVNETMKNIDDTLDEFESKLKSRRKQFLEAKQEHENKN
jgi:hypothetical protein